MQDTAAGSQTGPPHISIVIPVYNEEARIRSFLEAVAAYLQRQTAACELIVVDDGSRDGTVGVVEDMLGRSLPGCWEVLRLPRNRGKGGALQVGMLHARGDYVFFLDADGSTSIEEIDRFKSCFDPAVDVYIAVRTKKHYAPLKRKLFGYGYIFVANLLLRVGVSDYTCGFKCYRREAARSIFSQQRLDNWSFDAEDLYLARLQGRAIREIPVYWKHVGGSKVKVFHNVIVCGCDLLRILWNRVRGRYRG